MALLNTPLDVFTVSPMVLMTFGGLDFSLTNMSMFMVVVAIVVCTFFLYATFNKTLIPNTLQSFFESFFQFVLALVYKNMGKSGSTFFSFIFFLFSLILFTNALGLMPFSLAITGQWINTLSIAFAIFMGVIIMGIRNHKQYLLSAFFPAGSPTGLAPMLIAIEVISYFFSPLSLSIRLFANMMAGHTLLVMGLTFTAAMMMNITLLSGTVLITTVLLVLFMGLETGVACLQAYVFTLLSCFYLNNSKYLDH